MGGYDNKISSTSPVPNQIGIFIKDDSHLKNEVEKNTDEISKNSFLLINDINNTKTYVIDNKVSQTGLKQKIASAIQFIKNIFKAFFSKSVEQSHDTETQKNENVQNTLKERLTKEKSELSENIKEKIQLLEDENTNLQDQENQNPQKITNNSTIESLQKIDTENIANLKDLNSAKTTFEKIILKHQDLTKINSYQSELSKKMDNKFDNYKKLKNSPEMELKKLNDAISKDNNKIKDIKEKINDSELQLKQIESIKKNKSTELQNKKELLNKPKLSEDYRFLETTVSNLKIKEKEIKEYMTNEEEINKLQEQKSSKFLTFFTGDPNVKRLKELTDKNTEIKRKYDLKNLDNQKRILEETYQSLQMTENRLNIFTDDLGKEVKNIEVSINKLPEQEENIKNEIIQFNTKIDLINDEINKLKLVKTEILEQIELINQAEKQEIDKIKTQLSELKEKKEAIINS